MDGGRAKIRKVLLRRCETYDAAAIQQIVQEGIEELGERGHSRCSEEDGRPLRGVHRRVRGNGHTDQDVRSVVASELTRAGVKPSSLCSAVRANCRRRHVHRKCNREREGA
jgi:hypothetical protein